MREIEFRGKAKDGRWIFGTGHTDFLNIYASKCHSDKKGCMWLWSGYSWIEIIPETIGQYTGMKDKNGKKIFEGDIIGFCPFDCNGNDTPYTGVVVYSGATFMIWNEPESEYYGSDGGFDLDLVLWQDDEAEVIGNIHDNPEMVES